MNTGLPVLFECPAPADWEAKIRRKVTVTESGCWEFSPRNQEGYGAFTYKTADGTWRATGAHRAAWLAMRGPLGRGALMHHRCLNPPCCNPDHLEPVSAAENCTLGRNTRLPEHAPFRSIQVPHELWAEVKATAKARRLRLSEAACEALVKWVEEREGDR